MTANSEDTVTLPAPGRRRGLPVGKLALGFLIGVMAAAAGVTGSVLAFQQQYADRIVPGVQVESTDLSGLTREEARFRLNEAYRSYAEGSVTVRTPAGAIAVTFVDAGRRADVDAVVDQAFAVGRTGLPLDRLAETARSATNGTVIPAPNVVLDPSGLAARVAEVGRQTALSPVDATVTVTPTAVTASPASPGRSLDEQTAASAILAALADPNAPSDIAVDATYSTIEPTITDAEAAAARDAMTRMAQDIVLVQGTETWKITGATVRSWISIVAQDGSLTPVVDPAGAEKVIASLAKKINKPAKSATFLYSKSQRKVGVVAGSNGRKVDATASASAVATLLSQRAAGTAVPGAQTALSVVSVKPTLSTEAAQKAAPLMRKIGEWTTRYPVSERNGFSANITVPTRILDGYVVAPSARFDFWTAAGVPTRAMGYKSGGYIKNGHSVPTGALAGGICSCSTTLWNAAIRAGLQVTTRQNHQYYLTRYPLGLDATVFISAGGARTNMGFRNDTKYPVLIRGFARPGYVHFEIWSVPNGRTVSFSKPIVKNYRKAGGPIYEYVSSLPRGARRVIDEAHDGFDAWVTRTVRDASGKVIHTNTFRSHYVAVRPLIQIGR